MKVARPVLKERCITAMWTSTLTIHGLTNLSKFLVPPAIDLSQLAHPSCLKNAFALARSDNRAYFGWAAKGIGQSSL